MATSGKPVTGRYTGAGQSTPTMTAASTTLLHDIPTWSRHWFAASEAEPEMSCGAHFADN
jgi:hypothetical protein